MQRHRCRVTSLSYSFFSAQLKDTPLLRGTDLVGKTVYVDARKGTNLIAADELQKVIDAKGITVAEALSKAGSVKLGSCKRRRDHKRGLNN